ncbi:acyl-CoA/acyl-ACP dehydrogenase [Mesorhizobium sp. CGMCC 1.15528]|uniref:Acyl-CoA/acyl-ACP dehydrogenase n=1 Tax=Mesorhizobium zhangyense TaxID=1776730 RepID=A0A7C9R8U6_9HYPH|nr:acyl-CoA dehydrogenase family protein [Mesorhizobium zhangyense]NGN43042.1 acyl-CoA/acyl-ACP dehydrogenase [Mesorhizobium zhangyense]
MIDLNNSVEQTQIVDSVRAMLAESYPVARLREGSRSAVDNLDVIAQFGGFTMSLPEDDGGAGLSVVEDVLLHTELGRHIVSPSALARTIAVRFAGETGQTELVAALLDGTRKACLANHLGESAQSQTGSANGEHLHLYDVGDADLALVLGPRGVALLDVSSITHTHVASTDRTISLSRAVLGTDHALEFRDATTSSAARMARLLISAQLLGMCEAVRDMSVEYAKVRTQFGQPIGSFQAVKHRCANMAINADVLSAQLLFAAIAERDGWPDALFQIEACWLLACRYTLENCRSSIQVHGGIGFSAECDAHLYLLRTHLLENLGATNTQRQQAVLRWPI